MSPGERRGHGLALVFGSEMATRAYSEAATRTDLDDTKNVHIGRGRTGEGEGVRAGVPIMIISSNYCSSVIPALENLVYCSDLLMTLTPTVTSRPSVLTSKFERSS